VQRSTAFPEAEVKAMSILLRITAVCWLLAVGALAGWALTSPASLPLDVVAAFAAAWAIALAGARLIGGQGWDDARDS
jgi:hypothetical protein